MNERIGKFKKISVASPRVRGACRIFSSLYTCSRAREFRARRPPKRSSIDIFLYANSAANEEKTFKCVRCLFRSRSSVGLIYGIFRGTLVARFKLKVLTYEFPTGGPTCGNIPIISRP